MLHLRARVMEYQERMRRVECSLSRGGAASGGGAAPAHGAEPDAAVMDDDALVAQVRPLRF